MYIMISTKILITVAIWLTAIIGLIIVKPVSALSTNPTTPTKTTTAPTTHSSTTTAPTTPNSTPIAPTTPNSTPIAPTTPNSTSIAPTTPNSTSTTPTTPNSTPIAPTTPNSTPIAPTTPNSTSTTPTTPNSTPIAPTTPNSTSTTQTTPNSTSTSPTTPNSTPIAPTTPNSTPIAPTTPNSTPIAPTTPNSTSTTQTTPNSTPIAPTTPNSTPIAPTTPNSTSTTQTTPNSTPIAPTTPNSTSMAPAASSTMPSSPTVKISETNILITDSEDSLFVELEGKANESLHGVRLSVYNATSPLPVSDDASLSTLLDGTLDEQGRQVITKINNINLNWKAISVFESVLIVLGYNNTQESLLYSSKGLIDPGIAEKYNTSYNLILDTKPLAIESLSLSRCSPAIDTSSFILTHATKGKPNNCMLSNSHNLEMKLTRKGCTKDNLANDYNLTIANQIISEVNSESHCGFSRLMLKDFNWNTVCPDKENTELYVKFQVMYELPKQWELVLSGYQSFILDGGGPPKVLKLAEDIWVISNCTQNCLPAVKPPDSGDDDRIRVTVAVVVSCIGVFLIVLVFVIIYMKNKRRGILQFRMTRLDDDEDDLIGDMDDFVGNQGPTFRNFS